MEVCDSCKEEVQQVCHGGYCPKCHISVSWEDCLDGTWDAQVMMSSGRSKEAIRKMFPNARI